MTVALVDVIANDTFTACVVRVEGRGVGECVGPKLCPAARHEVAPPPLPVEQIEHTDEPELAWNMPTPHLLHWLAAAVEYVPAAHTAHTPEPFREEY